MKMNGEKVCEVKAEEKPQMPNIDDIVINMKKGRNVNFEIALEQTEYGRYNLSLTLISGLSFFVVCNEAYSLGYILPMIACDMNLNTYYKGLLTSVNFIGLAGSGLFWGYTADKKGRRNLLITCTLMSFASSIVGPFMSSFWGFSFTRFLNGIAISGPAAVLYAYVGEFHTATTRPKSMALLSLFMGVSFVFLPALSWATSLIDLQLDIFGLRFTSWRLYLFINSILNLIVALALMKFPESPRFLYYKRNVPEAFSVLGDMFASNTGKRKESYPVENLDEKLFFLEKAGTPETSMIKDIWNQITPFFEMPYLLYMLVGCLIQAVLFAVSSGLLIWYPDIVNQISNSANTNVSLSVCQALQMPKSNVKSAGTCTVENEAFIQSIIIGALYIVGYISWGFVVKMLGNRTFFLICMGLSSVSTVLLCFVTQNILINVFFMTTLVLPGISASVINTMMVDLFPTHMCGMSVCLVLTAGRLGSVISSTVVGMMLEWSCVTAIMLYAISLVANLLVSLLFPRHPITK